VAKRRQRTRSQQEQAPAEEPAASASRWPFRRRKKKPKKTLWQSTRETLDSILVALVLASVFRTFIMEAFEIPTGSMAPTLYGQHVDVTCGACGHHFSVGFDQSPDGGLPPDIVCPLCGTVHSIPTEFGTRGLALPADLPRRTHGGDRILVDKGAYTLGDPKRWEVGVFVNPHDPSVNYIKRVVGLPGDTVRIRHGDVYINGRISRKPAHVQEALWMPVFDANRPPNGSWTDPWPGVADVTEYTIHSREANLVGSVWNPPWQAVRGDGGQWGLDGPVFTFEPTEGDTRPSHVLFAWPIFDTYGYGQRQQRGLGRRPYDPIEAVGDVRLRADVALESAGVVTATIIEDETRIDFVLSADPAVPSSVSVNFKKRSTVAVPLLTPGRTHALAFYNVDDLAWVEIDGSRPLGREDYAGRRLPPWSDDPVGKAILLGAGASPARFANVRIDRDVFYTRTMNAERAFGVNEPYRLGLDEYFVLGDHSPSSRDSRRWWHDVLDAPSPAVTREHFIGKAFILYWPHNKPRRVKIIH